MIFSKHKPTYDYIVFGLGNPGLQYEKTRHNAGFCALDAMAVKFGFSFSKHRFDGVLGECSVAGKRVLAVKPQTYMNNSGNCVSKVISFYKVPLSNVIVLFDDISLDIGNIRIRRKGSAGGHNGIKDIIECCGSEEIPRIKIGVGKKPDPDYDLKDHVLGNIPKESRADFESAVARAADAVGEIIKSGIDSAMNKYSK